MARHGAGLAADALAQVDKHAVALGGVAFSAGRLAVDAGAGNARERNQGGTRAEAGQLAEKGAAKVVHGASGGLDVAEERYATGVRRGDIGKRTWDRGRW